MTFEEDYFGVPAGTFRDEITVLARKFAADVYKAPERPRGRLLWWWPCPTVVIVTDRLKEWGAGSLFDLVV